MLNISECINLGFLTILSGLLTFLLIYLSNKKRRKQLNTIFSVILILLIVWILSLILQIVCMNFYGKDPIYFDLFAFLPSSFLPVAFLLMSQIFVKTKITLTRKHFLLFIIPIISTVLAWTNDWHHLIYVTYSINLNDTVFGKYDIVYSVYTYLLFFIAFFKLLSYTTKNSGFFSRQAILITLGALIPVAVNILGRFNIIPMTVYLTPICFAFSVMFLALAIFKLKLTTVTPIALQRIVDRISDSYMILNEDEMITDFNATFLTTFGLKDSNARNMNIYDFLASTKQDTILFEKLKGVLKEVRTSTKTLSFDKYFHEYNKYFHIEVNAIRANKEFLGTLILFKDTTQHMLDIKTIRDTQDSLMESERLSSLGQLIGGIAHNLKTPIMSIAGAAEGLTDLVKEYDESIDDPTVTSQDHHEIAGEMSTWINKIKEHSEYMSDVITAVKGQAVAMSNEDEITFTISELIKRVNILMKHELKNAIVSLNIDCKIDENTTVHGDVNNLVQVINNMISNSIQAYNGKKEENIDFIVSQKNNNIIFSIKDYAGGLPKKVQEKLFKEMITTKGKNGTGLGLYMSNSTIKAHFNGSITYETQAGKGTRFDINIPMK